jgi:hypothetical protein
MSEFTFLKNRSGNTQFCNYKGQRLEMKGRAEEAFPPEIAKAFVEQCRGAVVELPRELGVRAEQVRPETLFLANWTGNPDSPEIIKQMRYNKQTKGHELRDEANPFHEPKFLYRTVGGTQSQAYSSVGTEFTINHPARNIEFPPYQYKELPKIIAEQILSQEAIAPQWMANMIREVPAPATFQPDVTWELEDIRAYLKYMDPDAILGPSLVQLQKQSEKSKVIFDILVVKSKRLLLQRLFFRIYSRDYRRPTKQEFDEFIGKAPATHLSEDAAMEMIRKAQAAKPEATDAA